MSGDLVLSGFPGIDLLGWAFEEAGYCVVRGPDVLWGGDIRRFHPPAGVFGGVIGGPPCQPFSRMRHLNPRCGERFGNLIPEFERVVAEARPLWFLMENVVDAPIPRIAGYTTRDYTVNNRWVGGIQERERRFSFGTPRGWGLDIEISALEATEYTPAVLSGSRAVEVKLGGSGKVKRTYHAAGDPHRPKGETHLSIEEMLRRQGAPEDLLKDCPWTVEGKRHAIGNGVPIPLGRAVAKAVRRAMAAADG